MLSLLASSIALSVEPQHDYTPSQLQLTPEPSPQASHDYTVVIFEVFSNLEPSPSTVAAAATSLQAGYAFVSSCECAVMAIGIALAIFVMLSSPTRIESGGSRQGIDPSCNEASAK